MFGGRRARVQTQQLCLDCSGIITIEDPIEYTFQDEKSLFQQREIGLDVPNFELGIKSVLRQNPDIILISRSCVASARGSSPTIRPPRITRIRVERCSSSGNSEEIRTSPFPSAASRSTSA